MSKRRRGDFTAQECAQSSEAPETPEAQYQDADYDARHNQEVLVPFNKSRIIMQRLQEKIQVGKPQNPKAHQKDQRDQKDQKDQISEVVRNMNHLNQNFKGLNKKLSELLNEFQQQRNIQTKFQEQLERITEILLEGTDAKMQEDLNSSQNCSYMI